MLSLSKHLYRFVASIELVTRAICFDKLSMTTKARVDYASCVRSLSACSGVS